MTRLPAFACAAENGHQEGMALRDYFAAKAMQGIIVNTDILDTSQVKSHHDIAKLAYDAADAMLQAREEKQ